METQTFTPEAPVLTETLITVTESAAGKIRELLSEEGKAESGLRVFVQGGGCSGFQYGLMIEEEGNADLKLRAFVQGGGCSGFQYGFTFDEAVNEDDTVMNKSGVQLLIDSMSYQYLVGAEIDYKDDINGAQFVIKNPNATTTCGCGSSFSV